MSKTTRYKQCVLYKFNGRDLRQTSWIPSKFAIVGNALRIKDDDGNWDLGWIVETVFNTELTESLLPDYYKEIKSHRKATGDSLPKEKHATH